MPSCRASCRRLHTRAQSSTSIYVGTQIFHFGLRNNCPRIAPVFIFSFCLVVSYCEGSPWDCSRAVFGQSNQNDKSKRTHEHAFTNATYWVLDLLQRWQTRTALNKTWLTIYVAATSTSFSAAGTTQSTTPTNKLMPEKVNKLLCGPTNTPYDSRINGIISTSPS